MQALWMTVAPGLVRVALVEGGQLQSLEMETDDSRTLIGNIYLGKILKVLPGIQSAFIDIGLAEAGFLQLADLQSHPGRIEDHLIEGRPLAVQVIKDPMGEKGARLSTRMTLHGRYLIYCPQDPKAHIRVSQKIQDKDERDRLVGYAKAWEPGASYVIRTLAAGQSQALLDRDYQGLRQQWQVIRQGLHHSVPGCCIYAAPALPMRALRDLVWENISEVLIDCKKTAEILRATYASEPKVASKIKLYEALMPLFDCDGIEEQVAATLKRHVRLPSGGALVFDRTEAMTTVDVNTGSFTQGRQEQTRLQTNLEAAAETARQLRLRNIGGIIIIDFIDMHLPAQRQAVMAALQAALAQDAAPIIVSRFSDFGLVALTRKRTQESIRTHVCAPCPLCEGEGVVQSVMAVCHTIYRALLRYAAQSDQHLGYRVQAAPEVVRVFLDADLGLHAKLVEKIEQAVIIEAGAHLERQHFEVVPLTGSIA